MSDTLITVIAVFMAAILMFVFPLMAISDTQDDIAQVAVQSLVSEFVNNAVTKGKITKDDYNSFRTKLFATGNTYDIQLEHKIMTVNPNKGTNDQLGENLYYSVFNNTILSTTNGLNDSSANNEYILKKGDYFVCTVKNTNTTLASQIKNFLYSIVGKDTYTIAGTSSGLVINTGLRYAE